MKRTFGRDAGSAANETAAMSTAHVTVSKAARLARRVFFMSESLRLARYHHHCVGREWYLAEVGS
jgi:hypothetical protein